MRLDFWRRGRRPFMVPHPDDLRNDRREQDHYTLAHVALRNAAFAAPNRFIEKFGGPGAAPHLARFIRWMETKGPEAPRRFKIQAKEVALHGWTIAGYPSVIIEMPQPRGMTRAFYTAAVLVGVAPGPATDAECRPLRYFTLELGCQFEPRRGRTVLGEWQQGDAHRNYGTGPPPELDAFVRAVEDLVNPMGESRQPLAINRLNPL